VITTASAMRIAAVLLIIMGGLIALLLFTDRDASTDLGDLHDVDYGDREDA
jgi:hypothetical protein